MAKLLYKNYECVKLMCERHPAHSQALIDELEAKLNQDTLFIRDVQQKLRESIFESHDFAANNKILQRAARDMTVLQNDMLVQRIRQREHLQLMSNRAQQVSEHEYKPNSRIVIRDLKLKEAAGESSDISDGVNGHKIKSGGSCEELARTWEMHFELIRRRTFIIDGREIFTKIHNSQSLQAQMRALHSSTELRQRELKKMLSYFEVEQEQVRFDSQSHLGSNSREARELQTCLGTQLVRHKHAGESALTAERLRQSAFGGIQHVCFVLGILPPDQDTPVNEIIHQVESVLEALMEEKDKTVQKIGDSHQPTFRNAASDPHDKLLRAPELDAALEQFETPKALIASRLPVKAFCELHSLHDNSDAGDFSEGIKCRATLKREALKYSRLERKRTSDGV